ncbi:MAG: helix-turn-helix transcriptional regulator [Jatrophihabitantaceae bacterium]
MLESLGFSKAAETLYRFLLQEPMVSDDVAAHKLGVPVAEVETARAQLIRSGLIRDSWDDDSGIAFGNPQLLLESALRRQETELAQRQEALAASRLGLESLLTEYLEATSQPSMGDEVVELVGREAIQRELETWSHKLRRELLALHPDTSYSAEQLASAQAMDLAALARGVKIRSVYRDDCRDDPAVRAYHRTVTRHGAEVRYAKVVPARLLVFDRQAGLIPRHTADNRRAALRLEGEGVAAMLVLSFDLVWSQATAECDGLPPRLETPGADRGPTDLDRILLQLLSMGVKDEAAARHLGVSVRTVRRQIADLMVRLEAGSRFEAGMQAAIRGWLRPPE